jgi:hypothetical protein
MNANMSVIKEIQAMIENAEAALKSAKKLLLEVSGADLKSLSSHGYQTSPSTGGPASKIVEGVFNGERMISSDGENFPIPANYASKSKLISGDHLKLSILEDGRFVYKQIGPAPRKTMIGTLVHDDGQYRVMAEGGKSYKVLLASVTYYKAQIGDKITLIIPEADDSEWGTIEAVLPKDMTELNVTDDQPEEEVEIDF